MALESSPCTGSMVRNNLHSHAELLSPSHVKGQQGQMLQSYLKLGWGVMVGVFPSMTPRSLMVRDPPGSSRAFRRSRTEALSTEGMISLFLSCWSHFSLSTTLNTFQNNISHSFGTIIFFVEINSKNVNFSIHWVHFFFFKEQDNHRHKHQFHCKPNDDIIQWFQNRFFH